MASSPPFEMEDQTDEDFFDKLVNDDDDDFVPPKPVTRAGSDVVSAFSNLSIEGSAGKSDLSVKGEGDSVDSDAGKGDVSSPVVENKALKSASLYDFKSMTESGLGAIAVTESSVGEKGFDLDKGLGNAEGGSGLGDEAGGESSVLQPTNSFDFNTGVELNRLGSEGLMGSVGGSSGLGDKAGGESSVLQSVNSFEFNTGVELKGSGSEGSMGSVGFSGGSKQVDWSSFHGFGSDSDFFSNLGNGGEELPVQEEGLGIQVNVMSSTGFASTELENSVYDGSYQEQQGYGTGNQANFMSSSVGFTSTGLENSVYDGQHQEQQGYGTGNEQSINAQDWENMYPGWKYDYNTGQWYQVENYDPSSNAQDRSNANVNLQDSANNFSSEGWPAASSDGQSDVGVSYLQQTAQSVAGTVSKTGTTESVSNWNQFSEVNNGYPEHMIFDPQYPGWYYDSIAQEWRTLDSYVPSVQQTSQYHDHQNQNESSTSSALQSSMYGDFGQANYRSQDSASQSQGSQWTGPYGEHNQYKMTSMWQPKTTAAKSNAIQDLGQQLNTSYGPEISAKNHVDQFKSFNSSATVPSYGKQVQSHAEVNGTFGMQPFVPSQPFNQANVSQDQYMHNSNSFYQSQNKGFYPQQSFQSGKQFPHNPTQGRSSEGRPPHALVTFGFGGKLIVMKDANSLSSSMYGNQGSTGASISVLNLMEVVQSTNDATGDGVVACEYFRALCQQALPGPLVGGNVGNKDLNKWIDDRIANCESSAMYYSNKRENLKLLLSLLKLACQHYGKLRSPFGTDTLLKEGDNPETAVAKLFSSAKERKEAYGPAGQSHCLQSLPSTEQVQAIASEVQKLLVSGKKMEALKYAQEGQLWGPALVLASQLGDQFYVDTIKQMALHQLVPGSPLRTLCLLIAGQPAEVFSAQNTTVGGIPGSQNMPEHTQQLGANGMLDDWEENLAVIAANRTKDDELVIIHLGDNLWKERSDITAAHICYLVAEANFESYSDSARLCLVGADHWKSPRTFASPEAIQRTELYEYAKVLGNSQFILLPFQPYKLIYAYMLAEVGKVSDSLKYCQALTKSLKTGRAPEVEMWKQAVLSLEERIRTYQQGGYSANLAPAKLVGKLLNFFDNTAHKVVGGLPPPAPATSQASTRGNYEQFQPPLVPKVLGSQSTMAMSSLIPSASMEPISEWTADNNKMTFHNRSVSEPDFGRSPRQVASSNEGSVSQQDKASVSGRSSGLGRFFQRTVGLVLRPRNDKQAKLGEKNKFYYDEKLKRWVEEGAEPPAEEAVLPPPPTTKAFQNGMPDYNLKSALKNERFVANGSPEFSSPTPSDSSSGMPPIPPSSNNQFSARGRMGVRSRYVDTFNKGGGSPANLFQTPSVPAVKPAVAGTPKFFVPSPAAPGEQTMETISESVQEDTPANENPPASTSMSDRIQSSAPASSSSSMQRFPSMDNIPSKGTMTTENGPLSSHSRRTASWSGSFNDAFSPPKNPDIKPLGEALGMSPTFMQSDAASMRMSASGGSLADDLHEVEL